MVLINNLSKIYKSKRKQKTVAIHKLSCTLPDKGLIYIIGKSGSGKSSLLNLLGGIDKISEGEILCFDHEISKLSSSELEDYRNTLVGFIFQDYHLLEDLTVKENVALALDLQNEENETAVENVLSQMELTDLSDRYPRELSGGQKQRVCIARALVKNPKIILADEPTGNLDSKTTEQINGILKEISKNTLVILVSHDLFSAYTYADRILELSNGELVNDIARNPDASENYSVENNTLTVPYYKKLTSAELKSLETALSKKTITSFSQENSNFSKSIPTKYEVQDNPLRTKTLSLKKQWHLCLKFAKPHFPRSLISTIIAAFLMVILIVCQSILSFDKNAILSRQLQTNRQTSAPFLKTEMEQYPQNPNNALCFLTEEEFQEIEDHIGRDHVFKLTNYSLTTGINQYLDTEKSAGVGLHGRYLGSSLGNLECTPNYLAEKYAPNGQLDIYTGNVVSKKSGVYITDFLADSILHNLSKYTTYDQLLGEYAPISDFQWGYINGIIRTQYADRYSELLSALNETTMSQKEIIQKYPQYVDFYDEVVQYLGMTYTFEEDFSYHLANELSRNGMRITFPAINGKPMGDDIVHFIFISDDIVNEQLDYNEILMDYRIYNTFFNTNYTIDDIETFTPHTINLRSFRRIDEAGTSPILDIDVTVRLANINHTQKFVCSDALLRELLMDHFVCHGVVFSNIEDINVVNEIIHTHSLSPHSFTLSSVFTMSQFVSGFRGIFTLIFVILSGTMFLILVLYSLNIVKEKGYDIGVIKALGGKTKSFAFIFGIQIIALGIAICLFTLLGTFVFMNLANTLFLESMQSVITSQVLIDIDLLTIDGSTLLVNCFAVLLISFASTVIPLFFLKSIKPMAIIKARD